MFLDLFVSSHGYFPPTLISSFPTIFDTVGSEVMFACFGRSILYSPLDVLHSTLHASFYFVCSLDPWAVYGRYATFWTKDGRPTIAKSDFASGSFSVVLLRSV